VGKLKAIHIMCKRDTESAKLAPESVLSNREGGISKVRTSQLHYERGADVAAKLTAAAVGINRPSLSQRPHTYTALKIK